MLNYSAAQIVADACAIAKCPGYVAQGGRALNLVLDDLLLHRNLKINLVTESLPLPAYTNGPLLLPVNYLRTYDLFFYVSGDPYFLRPASLREYDQEVQNSGITDYPYEWASDLSPTTASGGQGLLYIYPQSGTPLTLTHRYYLEQAPMTTPETNATPPWFPDQDYLIHATATRLMKITDDSRYEKFELMGERMLEKHLIMEGDEQQVVKEVALDPRRFRVGGSNRPTKLDPY